MARRKQRKSVHGLDSLRLPPVDPEVIMIVMALLKSETVVDIKQAELITTIASSFARLSTCVADLAWLARFQQDTAENMGKGVGFHVEHCQ